MLAGELSKADEVDVEALEHEPPSRRRLGTLRAAARQSGDSDENDSEVVSHSQGLNRVYKPRGCGSRLRGVALQFHGRPYDARVLRKTPNAPDEFAGK